MLRRTCIQNLNYHRLESRQFLAGDVTVALSDGRLELRGDDLANEISIIGTSDQGTRVVPTAGTTINGGTVPFQIDGLIRSVDLSMAGGDDVVTISGLIVTDGLVARGNAGNDRIQFSDINVRFLEVIGGDGNDVLEFHNTFGRKQIHIEGQAGDDAIAITAMAAGRLVRIDAGDGSDTIAIKNLGVRNLINIQAGTGDDIVMMTGEVYGHKTDIRLEDGNDALGVFPRLSGSGTTATFQKRLAVFAGAGDDQVFLAEGSSVFGKAILEGAAGNDSLGTVNSLLKRQKTSEFENRHLANLDQALDTFFSRLSAAGIDTAAFGREDQSLAPVLSMSTAPLNIPQGSGPLAIDSQLTLTGSAGTTATGATIRVVDAVSTQDVLAFANSGSITGQFNAATGILTLSGSATLEQYQAALRTVTYDNIRNPQVASTRRVEVAVVTNNGTANGSRSLSVQGLEAPVLNVNDGVLQLTRSASATAVDNQLTFTGSGFNATGATVRVANFVSADDTLAFTNTSSITGDFDDATGILTLTGTASTADYQTALRSITFDNTSSTFTGIKTINFTVNTERGEVSDTRSIQILTDQEAIDNFASTNSLTLQRTASGLNYIIETPGNNLFPTSDDSVRVKYRGTLLDGRQFDANDNALFPLDNVIAGFREGLLLFSEGAIGELFIPSSLGYRETGTANIPPNAVLRFEIELLDVSS